MVRSGLSSLELLALTIDDDDDDDDDDEDDDDDGWILMMMMDVEVALVVIEVPFLLIRSYTNQKSL